MGGSTEYYIRQFLALLADPMAWLGAVFIGFLLVMCLRATWGWWALLAGLLFCAIVSPTIGGWLLYGKTQGLFLPFEVLKRYSRIFCFGLLVVMALGAMFRPARRWDGGGIGAVFAAFVLLHILLILRLLVSPVAMRGLVSIPLMGVIFYVVILGCRRRILCNSDVVRLYVAILGSAVLFCALSLFQYVLSPSSVEWKNRFFGIGSNPQQVGVICALAIQIGVWLFLASGAKVWARVVLAGAVGLLAIVLFWTGSRTALAAAIVGLPFVVGRRLVGGVFVAGMAFVVVWVSLQWLGIQAEHFDRLKTIENTRGWVWAAQWAEFMDNPLVGNVGERFKTGESSWLGAAKTMGIAGLLAVLFAFVANVVLVVRCFFLTAARPDLRALWGVASAQACSVWLTTPAEAYLLMPLAVPFLVLLFSCSVLEYIKAESEKDTLGQWKL